MPTPTYLARLCIAPMMALCLSTSLCRAAETPLVAELKVTILSTMLTEFQGIGEWGFAALVEADGQQILFDTGGRPEAVLKNAKELGIDLSPIETVIISHNHWDHTGGLVSLRKAIRAAQPTAMQTTHVGEGIFLDRHLDSEAVGRSLPIPQELIVSMSEVREGYEALGGTFVVHEKPHEIHPGIWITGPIPRVHNERNWTPFMKVKHEAELVEDVIPEDQALVINTASGLVVIAGCGHAGIVNTMEYARTIAQVPNVFAVLGGFHLMSATDEHLEWTGSMMHGFGVEQLVGAHCTGINAVSQLREASHLDRESAVVGLVGSVFTLEEGIQLGRLNR